MIRNWIEAIGDASPVYTDAEVAAASGHAGAGGSARHDPGLDDAGPARGGRADDDPLGAMSLALDEAGYTSVVATNCDQVYYRYLRHGEQVQRAGQPARRHRPQADRAG